MGARGTAKGMASALASTNPTFTKHPSPLIPELVEAIGHGGRVQNHNLIQLCNKKELDLVIQTVDWMDERGCLVPKEVFYYLVQECTLKKDLKDSRRVASLVARKNLSSVSFWGDQLIRLFTSCGSLQDANEAFSNVVNPTVYTWGAIISGHVKLGKCDRALELYDKMQVDGIKPDKVTYFCVLKACANTGDITQGKVLHDEIITLGLEGNIAVGNTLVDLYAKCGCLHEAHSVFDKLPSRTIVSWGALIAGYAQNEKSCKAFQLLDEMQQQGLEPNGVILLSIMKVCGDTGALEQGRLAHEMVIRGGLESDMPIVTALIDMYAKSSSLSEARRIFDVSQTRDVICWGTMIAGYAQHGPGSVALELFGQMQKAKAKPDRVIFLSVLKACENLGSVEQSRMTYDQIVKVGLETDLVIGNTLIDLYAKHESLDEALKIFNQLPKRDVVSWGTLIAGHAQCKYDSSALKLFELMLKESVNPDEIIFLWVLKACKSSGDICQGRSIYNQIVNKGFETNVMIGSSLVGLYASCGSLEEAESIFDKLIERNVVSWGALISGHVQQGHDSHALNLFKRMKEDCIKLDEGTCVCLLRACRRLRALNEGRLLHEQIRIDNTGLEPLVANALIEMYSACGNITEARQVFEDLQSQNASCWGAMIIGYVECGFILSAFGIFEKMQHEGISPGKVAYLGILKACGLSQVPKIGKVTHDAVMRSQLELDALVGSALIDMYVKCLSLEEADNVLMRLPKRDFITWGALIDGYAQHGHGHIALELFEKMLIEGAEPDTTLLLSVLKACAIVKHVEGGRLIHSQIIADKLEDDVGVGSALIDLYAKCGYLKEARSVFNRLDNLTVDSCSALISGYVAYDSGLLALEVFSIMLDEGIQPEKITFLCILKACSAIGALGQGSQVHNQVIETGLEVDNSVGNTLIDMYVKCGKVEEAHKVFEQMHDRDVVSWTAIIAAYTSDGKCNLAFESLKHMQNDSIKPDCVLLSSILAACSHNGLLEEGCQLFMQMRDLEFQIDHYNCIVNLLGRGGCLNEAEDLVKTMPVSPNIVGWLTLLTGSKMYGHFGLGRECFDETLQLDSG